MDDTWARALNEYGYDDKNRKETLDFQKRFSSKAGDDLCAWYKVVRWKSPRSARKTIDHINDSGVTAGNLKALCQGYINNPRRETFRPFREKIAKTGALATAATFPAFLCPDLFPMVDTQTTRWVAQNPWTGIRPARIGKGVLYERHWEYVWEWIEWCRRAASALGDGCTPRDVEMAVFTAQRNKLTLNRLAVPTI